MYSGAATYRGGSFPAFDSSSSNDRVPLFGRKRKGTVDWDRLVTLSCVAVCVLLFVGVLYQGNQSHLHSLKKEHLQREVERLEKESASLRASLSNQQQIHDSLEHQLSEAISRNERVEQSISRSHALRESLQIELRDVQTRLGTCERNAKTREEELEANVQSAVQERNDLKIRVDTEHNMSMEWARKVAFEQAEKERCNQQLKQLTEKQPDIVHSTSNTVEDHHTTDVDLGRKAGAEAVNTTVEHHTTDVDLGRRAGAEGEAKETTHDTEQKENQKHHRMDLE